MCSRTIVLILLLSVCFMAGAAPPPVPADDGFQLFDVWYVDDEEGDDLDSGESPALAFKTIGKALSVANANDIVYVLPGHYDGENFPLAIPNGVKLYAREGAVSTTIYGDTGKNVIVFDGVGSGTVVSGFRIGGSSIFGGSPSAAVNGGAVVCRNSAAAVIDGNYFSWNSVTGGTGTAGHPNGGNAAGGAIYADGSSTCTIRNNVFVGNRATGGKGVPGLDGKGGLGRGGAVYVAGPSVVVHNTFHINSAYGGYGSTGGAQPGGDGGNSWGGALYAIGGATVANNIFTANKAVGGTGGSGTPAGDSGTGNHGGLYASNATVTHNDLHGSQPAEAIAYPNSFNFDPKYFGWWERIRVDSAARGAGSPTHAATHDYDGNKRPSPPTLGAHEPRVRGDMDGNGTCDLFWRKADTGENAVWLMNGLQIASSAFVPNNAPSFFVAGIGDFNADRKTDVLFRNGAGEHPIWMMDGASVLQIKSAPAYGSMWWSIMAVADVNGDGTADILWHNALSNANSVWIMSGATMLASIPLGTNDSGYAFAGAADFNGDGTADLLWRNGSTGQNQLWKIHSNGAVQTWLPQNGAWWKVAGIGDFSGDGLADILWRNPNSGHNELWPIVPSGGGFFEVQPAQPVLQIPDQQWSVVKVGDFDADGSDDLLWRHAGSGDLAVWLMNGSAIDSSAFLPVQLADPNWKVAR